MLKQLFNKENFRKIYDIENRKGLFIEKKFFKDIYKISQDIKLLPKNNENDDRIKKLKQQKEDLIAQKLNKIIENCENNAWDIKIEKSQFLHKEKYLYKIKNNSENFFLIKQLQYNLNRSYKVKTANRQQIVTQLKQIIKDGLPKAVIKLDISSFYESIDTNKLKDKLIKDALLSILSKNMIFSILDQYNNLSGNNIGIPRGIGISAFLSEIYMKDIDAKFKKNENIFFYARYVDDIIIVTDKDNAKALKENVRQKLNEYGLNISEEKTKIIEFDNKQNNSFDYLGYSFSKDIIGLSEKRIDKYKKKIDLIFESLNRKIKTNRRKAIQLLKKRIKYLTGNTKLKNTKSSILTGVYFSNILLDNKQLLTLDDYLKDKIKLSNLSEKLKNKLLNINFNKGFITKKYYNFSLKDLSEITKIWKDI